MMTRLFLRSQYNMKYLKMRGNIRNITIFDDYTSLIVYILNNLINVIFL